MIHIPFFLVAYLMPSVTGGVGMGGSQNTSISQGHVSGDLVRDSTE